MSTTRSFLIVSSILITSLTSCMRKELPVPAHNAGNVTTATVNMESDYRYQIYYNLKDNKVVGQNLKTVWDLGFETSANGWYVVLNGAKAMFVLPTGKTDIGQVTIADTTGWSAKKAWDNPSGSYDSTAIGDWRTVTNRVYIIDRGFNAAGVAIGFEKIQIHSVDATTYSVEFAPVNAATSTRLQIAKDSLYNLSYLSFDANTVISVEPPKATWDLMFSQYTHTFYDPSYMPYLVTGCLLNRSQTLAASSNTVSFDSITYEFASKTNLSAAINTIGYDWKTYTNNVYLTDAKKAYIIRDANGFFYKLHFIDFLSAAGVKGNPKWEYQRL